MSARLLVAIVAAVAAATLGLLLGLGIQAECPSGPVPDLARGLWTAVVVALTALLVASAVLLAVARRGGRSPLVLLLVAAGLAGGFFAALTFGPRNCPPPLTRSVEGDGQLRLNEPYSTTLTGMVTCELDRASGRTLDLAGGVNRSEPPDWTAGDMGVDFLLNTRALGGHELELVLSQPSRAWGYRSAAPEHIDVTVDGATGRARFTGLPLISDGRPSASPVPESVSGELSWECSPT